MLIAGAAALILLGFASAAQDAPPRAGGVNVRQQIIIRVQSGPREAAAGAPLVRWRERRGPRCVSARQIVGATLLGQNSVDLILRDNRRLRARLERRCPALDYYYGFYVSATEDGRICADRDAIRSRVGGECMIDEINSLTPERE